MFMNGFLHPFCRVSKRVNHEKCAKLSNNSILLAIKKGKIAERLTFFLFFFVMCGKMTNFAPDFCVFSNK